MIKLVNSTNVGMKIVLFLFSLIAGCATISQFDHYAYVQSTSVKVDALNLMDLAVNDYSSQTSPVKDVEIQIQKIYEYEKNRPKNEITIGLWDKLRDPQKNLYGGFIARWKNEGTLKRAFIDNSKELVSDAFDQLLQLESKKIKPTDIK